MSVNINSLVTMLLIINYQGLQRRFTVSISPFLIGRLPLADELRSMWGLASIYAYDTYNESEFLHVAQDVWQNVSAWKVTREEATKGKHDGKDSEISSTCNNSTYPKY